ncbi:MAG: TetR family transcriptional regulator C-terminal domain-containing protein [Bacteroidia bacterium]|jgi:AcrR family transcriptional regulator|nr:TetR family transcriptional regulator C-terminal domain-containing protein [Bacteroidia bacterium]
MKNQIVSEYVKYCLKMGHSPANVFQLCEHLGIAETEFYSHFGSLDKVEESVIVSRWQSVAEKFAQDDQFAGFSITEKMLTLHFAFIESLREIRSYLLWKFQDWKNPTDQVKGLMSLREAFQKTVTPMLDMAVNQGEIPDRKVVSKLNVEALGMNLAFVMHFWLKDDSADFERTDACIEKSVQLTMDFVGRNAVDKLFDFGKFLIQGFQR